MLSHSIKQQRSESMRFACPTDTVRGIFVKELYEFSILICHTMFVTMDSNNPFDVCLYFLQHRFSQRINGCVVYTQQSACFCMLVAKARFCCKSTHLCYGVKLIIAGILWRKTFVFNINNFWCMGTEVSLTRPTQPWIINLVLLRKKRVPYIK